MDYDVVRRNAADIREGIIRAIGSFGGGHIGGCLSVADALAVLYGGKLLKFNPQDPNWEGRDKVVMSKGHCAPALYAALAAEGFFPYDWLYTTNANNTLLPSHCDRLRTPGIDAGTGSLGQGISMACGFAVAARLKKNGSMTYVFCGDGEMQEGEVWEAVEFAAHHKLGRLCLFADMNKKQLDGWVSDICQTFDTAGKFKSFGWNVIQVKGDDVEEIAPAVEVAMRRGDNCAPTVIILDSEKGCGCDFAEKEFDNHWIDYDLEEAERSVAEVERRLAAGLLPGGEKK